jgi:hypothetical protein
MIAASPVIDCRTAVLRAKGRLIVCCEIEHFILSGLTVPELLFIDHGVHGSLRSAIRVLRVETPGATPEASAHHQASGHPQLSRLPFDLLP